METQVERTSVCPAMRTLASNHGSHVPANILRVTASLQLGTCNSPCHFSADTLAWTGQKIRTFRGPHPSQC